MSRKKCILGMRPDENFSGRATSRDRLTVRIEETGARDAVPGRFERSRGVSVRSVAEHWGRWNSTA
jgi:hypothetical protein